MHSRLSIIGGGEIKSTEHTTQGDTIAMAVYAIAIIPLILMIVEITSHADNTTKTAAYDHTVETLVGHIMRTRSQVWILSRSSQIMAYHQGAHENMQT